MSRGAARLGGAFAPTGAVCTAAGLLLLGPLAGGCGCGDADSPPEVNSGGGSTSSEVDRSTETGPLGHATVMRDGLRLDIDEEPGATVAVRVWNLSAGSVEIYGPDSDLVPRWEKGAMVLEWVPLHTWRPRPRAPKSYVEHPEPIPDEANVVLGPGGTIATTSCVLGISASSGRVAGWRANANFLISPNETSIEVSEVRVRVIAPPVPKPGEPPHSLLQMLRLRGHSVVDDYPRVEATLRLSQPIRVKAPDPAKAGR